METPATKEKSQDEKNLSSGEDVSTSKKTTPEDTKVDSNPTGLEVTVEYIRENYFPPKDEPSVPLARKNNKSAAGGMGYSAISALAIQRMQSVKNGNRSAESHSSTTSTGAKPNQKAKKASPRRITDAMKKEWRAVLKKDGKIKCPITRCTMEFGSFAGLHAHYLFCPGYIPKNVGFSCTQCPAVVLTHRQLLSHVTKSHGHQAKRRSAAGATDVDTGETEVVQQMASSPQDKDNMHREERAHESVEPDLSIESGSTQESQVCEKDQKSAALPMTVTAKRKPGRPRKSQTPTTKIDNVEETVVVQHMTRSSQDKDISHKKERVYESGAQELSIASGSTKVAQVCEKDQKSGTSPMIVTPKRKPGRPKKSQTPTTKTDDTDCKDVPSDSSIKLKQSPAQISLSGYSVENTTVSPAEKEVVAVKRKRGRPRRSTGNPIQLVDERKPEQNYGSHVGAEGKEVAVARQASRKRSRESDQAPHDEILTENLCSPPVKRKRGRKPKMSTTTPVTDAEKTVPDDQVKGQRKRSKGSTNQDVVDTAGGENSRNDSLESQHGRRSGRQSRGVHRYWESDSQDNTDDELGAADNTPAYGRKTKSLGKCSPSTTKAKQTIKEKGQKEESLGIAVVKRKPGRPRTKPAEVSAVVEKRGPHGTEPADDTVDSRIAGTKKKRGRPKTKHLDDKKHEEATMVTKKSEVTSVEALGVDHDGAVATKKKGRKKGKSPDDDTDCKIDLKCERCGATVNSLPLLKSHLLAEHKAVWSRENPAGDIDEFYAFKKLGKISCDRCDRIFKYMSYYRFHVKWCGKEDDMALCSVCNKEVRAMYLTQHIRQHRLQEEKAMEREKQSAGDPTPEEVEVTPGGRMKRQAADKALKNLRDIQEEMQNLKKLNTFDETTEKKYQIPKTANIDKNVVKKWIKELKNGEAKCIYEKCKQTCNRLRNMKNHHIICEHSGVAAEERLYKCNLCGKLMNSETAVIYHVGTHKETRSIQEGDSDLDDDDRDPDVVLEGHEESEEDDDNMSSGVSEESWEGEEEEEEAPEKKQSSSRATPRRQSKLLFADGWVKAGEAKFASALEWTLDWYQAHYSLNVLPEQQPMKKNWSLLDNVQAMEYLPMERESPTFHVTKLAAKTTCTSVWPETTLKRFDSACINKGGAIFNAGGPVWSMAWCPVPITMMEVNQYAAIYSHRTMEETHSVFVPWADKGTVQIWDLGVLSLKGKSCGKPQLSYVVAHDFGCVWDIKWCPQGGYDIEDPPETDDHHPRLGLLALACSDSMVHIISVPKPSSLCGDDRGLPPVYKPLKWVTLKRVHTGIEDTMCLDMDWIHSEGEEVLAAGYSDGSVSLYNLSTCSPLLRRETSSTSTLFAYMTFQAHNAPVSGVAFSRMKTSLIMTCSYDRYTSFWDLNNPDVAMQSIQKGLMTGAIWPLHWPQVMAFSEDSYNLEHNCVTTMEMGYFGINARPSSIHNSSIVGADFSDWTNTLLSGDTAGELLAMYLPPLILSNKHFKHFPKRRFCIFSTALEEIKDKRKLESQEEPSASQESKSGGSNMETRECSAEHKTKSENTSKDRNSGESTDCEKGLNNVPKNGLQLVNDNSQKVGQENMAATCKSAPCTSSCPPVNTSSLRVKQCQCYGSDCQCNKNTKQNMLSNNRALEGESSCSTLTQESHGQERANRIPDPVSHVEQSANQGICNTGTSESINNVFHDTNGAYDTLNSDKNDHILPQKDRKLNSENRSKETKTNELNTCAAQLNKKSVKITDTTPKEQDKKVTKRPSESSDSHGAETYKEAVEKYCIVYEDHDVSQIPSKSTKYINAQKLLAAEDLDIFPLQAIHKVCWNPNLGSHLWLLSAGQAGLVRLLHVPGLETENTASVMTRARKTGHLSKAKIGKKSSATQMKDSGVSDASTERVVDDSKGQSHTNEVSNATVDVDNNTDIMTQVHNTEPVVSSHQNTSR